MCPPLLFPTFDLQFTGIANNKKLSKTGVFYIIFTLHLSCKVRLHMIQYIRGDILSFIELVIIL